MSLRNDKKVSVVLKKFLVVNNDAQWVGFVIFRMQNKKIIVLNLGEMRKKGYKKSYSYDRKLNKLI